MSEKRCTGHCCRRFFLPNNHEELERKKRTVMDGLTIAPMLIELGPHADGHGAWFTCIYLDGADCSIYTMRPAMCREYPYDRHCGYVGCTAQCLGLVDEALSRYLRSPNTATAKMWIGEDEYGDHAEFAVATKVRLAV